MPPGDGWRNPGRARLRTGKPADERLLTLFAPLERTVHAYREHLSDVVAGLRQREVSWAKIAEPLGVSRQSAWERFS